MSPNEKPGTSWGWMDVFLAGFTSLITAGVLPAIFYSMARARRRRIKDFIVMGLPATARVIDMTLEDIAFSVQITRVRYEFEVDGWVRRDSDQVMTWIANRWDRGTPIQILYIPARYYDSVIVSTS